jgi:hypothetical protein
VEKAPVFAKKQTKGPFSIKKIDYAFLALIPVIILWVSLLCALIILDMPYASKLHQIIVSGSSSIIT